MVVNPRRANPWRPRAEHAISFHRTQWTLDNSVGWRGGRTELLTGRKE